VKRCACCNDATLRLSPFFGGICGYCRKLMLLEFEELACDRAENFNPDTWRCDLETRELQHDKREKNEWVKTSFAMKDRRREIEELVDGWREIELGKIASGILAAERDDYLNKRIDGLNARPNRQRGRAYARRGAGE